MRGAIPRLMQSILMIGVCITGISCGNTGFGFRSEPEMIFSGTIETREIRIGSKVGGRVSEVLVREGDEVKAGEIIVRLDVGELKAQLDQAEARADQQSARLKRLERGARPEEKGQARAATETARANLDAVRNWPRQEDVGQAKAAVSAAESDLSNAQATYNRAEKLRENGDISIQDYDSAKYRLESVRANRDVVKKRLDLLLNGSRKEDIRAAEERFRQAQEAERLVLAGPRVEEIADARAQLAEVNARVDQIKIQLAEGDVVSPANAVAEVISIRPGDLLAPNQPVARLLEKDQLWVRIYIPEPQLGIVKVGQKAEIMVDTFNDRIFDGLIEQINTQGEFTPRNIQSRDERNHQVFGVKVRIDNKDGVLKAGMAAEVKLKVESRK